MAVQRRVTSVLFGDLVGFTTFSETRDAEEVRDLLAAYFTLCRTIVARYEGVVEKFIGDAVMAVWGVPVAREDDAERSVRAGLELLDAITGLGEGAGVPGLSMRVGVVTGEVAVTVGASGEGMVAGDAVNTAARVQGVAEPGALLVNDLSRSLTARAVSYTYAGEHLLKGKTRPLRLWQARAVVAELAGGQRIDGLEAPLAGRAHELRLVKELFHAAEESGKTGLVVLDGEAGIGKSRLVWEFEKYVDGLGATIWWHRGRCLSYGDGAAFWALAEAVRGRLGLLESDSSEVAAARLDATLDEIDTNANERGWLQPRLATLLGIPTSPAAPVYAREELHAAWTVFFERVGHNGEPVVLVIEDAQHADDGLLDFLDQLLTTARAGIFVLIAARPELLSRRPDLGGRRTTVIRLHPLDEAAMGLLVDGLVDTLPREAHRQLVARAEGVPLFAVETVRALIDRDLIIPVEGRYSPAPGLRVDLDTIGAPASLQALIAARLDALKAGERRLLARASVLGSSFPRSSIHALCGEDITDVDHVLRSLVAKELLSIQTDRLSAERGQYRFVQSVVRQVAYATQSRRDRKSLHIAAAKHLEGNAADSDDLSAVIAQHLLDAVHASTPDDATTPELVRKARDLLKRASRRALSVGSPGEALRHLETALLREPQPEERAELHLSAAEAALRGGHWAATSSHATAAFDWFETNERTNQAAIAIAIQAELCQLNGENQRAVELAEPLWNSLEVTPDSAVARLKLVTMLYACHFYLGNTRADYAEQAILLAESLNDHAALTRAYNSRGIYYSNMSAPTTALAMFESAARIAEAHDLPDHLSRSLLNKATVQISRDLSSALQSGEQAQEAARRSGNVNLADYASANHLLAVWTAGRLTEARDLLMVARASARTPDVRTIFAVLDQWTADAAGDLDVAMLGVEPSDDTNTLAWQGNLAIRRALHDGDEPTVIRGLISESFAHLLASGGIEDDFMHLWPPLILAALQIGDLELVERLLEPVSATTAGSISPAVRAQYRRLNGLLCAARGKDPSAVEDHFRAAITAFEAFGAVAIRARTEQELASWIIHQGRASDAIPLLEHARDTYRHIGAFGWLAELDSVKTQEDLAV